MFARTPNTTSDASRLFTAKTPLAPRSIDSLPRLELCAMSIAAKTTEAVLQVFQKMQIRTKLFAHSDSTIALAWIKSEPHRFNAFIANREVQIRRQLQPEIWYHVRYPSRESSGSSHAPNGLKTLQRSRALVVWPPLATQIWPGEPPSPTRDN